VIRQTKPKAGALRIFAAIFGALFLIDAGIDYTREEDRRSSGYVTPGIVVEKLSSTGEQGTRVMAGRGAPRGAVRTPDFGPYDYAVRILATGSPSAWVIDYRFGCSYGYNGTCYGRDFVEHDLWARLRAGQYVNIRKGKNERGTSRLDENSSWRPVIAKFTISGVLLAFVWLTGPSRRRREWPEPLEVEPKDEIAEAAPAPR
jgi:hypothetical protein